ncbi:MAG: hypothetical protein P4L55_04055 [Syntrophobacteraceae bacterium]|nr:hypothetical protein [Syntrophobacteraceae bacterium]
MTGYRFPKMLRDLISESLPVDTATFGQTPDLRHTYVPASHARALHPDSMLVVGIRGAGKSFWWSALKSEDHRQLVANLMPKAGIDTNTLVGQGFGERSLPLEYPGKDVLAKLIGKFDARQIWRTVIARQVAILLKENTFPTELKSWEARTNWLVGNPEEVEKLLFDADNQLDLKKSYLLILFDALDRTADEWPSMSKLVRGLLQVLLEFRAYKRIRPKAFVRPDHLEDAAATNFPDSSKVLTQMMELRWPRIELYSLFWQYLANESDRGELFRKGCLEGFQIRWRTQSGIWTVPERLRIEEDLQRNVFHAITGPWMGRDRRRGFPYTWLPGHLGDAHRQVSPRSFLAALRHASEDGPRTDYDYALYYESVKRGVQEASRIRVREMQEDYPWVEELMKPLTGISVPCTFAEIANRWKKGRTIARMKQDIVKATVKLPPVHFDEGDWGVREDLEALGVFERMTDGRVNLPDVYRVGYGIGRRGGVKAVARG